MGDWEEDGRAMGAAAWEEEDENLAPIRIEEGDFAKQQQLGIGFWGSRRSCGGGGV